VQDNVILAATTLAVSRKNASAKSNAWSGIIIAVATSLNVKTARLWRAILPSTHLAREGRMTVTIGRRELLAALGGAVAWPLAV
jgi:hypothetical protein